MTILLDSSVGEIEETFRGFLRRDDIGIILINQNVRTVTTVLIATFKLHVVNLMGFQHFYVPYVAVRKI